MHGREVCRMKWGALALALVVLLLTAGAVGLTMRSSGTDPVIPSPATSVLDPVKRALHVTPSCQNDEEGHDSSGKDAKAGRCNSEAGNEQESGSNENEPDEK